jgi:hypothetical protein
VWTGAAVGAVLLLALVNLPMPFFGDQGLYALGAAEMAGGERLYADFWDFKQPGIFLFFLVARKLFGPGELGPHLLEVAWLVAWTLVAARVLRPRWAPEWAPAAFVVASVGLYEVAAQTRHITQLEILLSPVVLLGVLLVRRGVDGAAGADRWALLGGLCGGLAAVAKLAYGPLVLAPLVVHLAARRRVAVRPALVAAAGVLVPVGVVMLWYATQGAMPELVDSWFTFPRRYVTEVPDVRTPDKFVELVKGGAALLAPLVVTAAAGLATRRRAGTGDRVQADLLVLVAGVLVLDLAQLWSDFHFLLLYAPLAVLAVDGFVDLAREGRALRRVAVALTVLAAVPAAGHEAQKLGDLASHAGDARAFQDEVAPGYAALAETGAILRADHPGTLYALADPTLFVYAGRTQTLRLNGWSPQDLLDDQWAELVDGLRGAGAPRYVFVQDGFDAQFGGPGAGFAEALDQEYAEAAQLPAGVLYERR